MDYMPLLTTADDETLVHEASDAYLASGGCTASPARELPGGFQRPEVSLISSQNLTMIYALLQNLPTKWDLYLIFGVPISSDGVMTPLDQKSCFCPIQAPSSPIASALNFPVVLSTNQTALRVVGSDPHSLASRSCEPPLRHRVGLSVRAQHHLTGASMGLYLAMLDGGSAALASPMPLFSTALPGKQCEILLPCLVATCSQCQCGFSSADRGALLQSEDESQPAFIVAPLPQPQIHLLDAS